MYFENIVTQVFLVLLLPVKAPSFYLLTAVKCDSMEDRAVLYTFGCGFDGRLGHRQGRPLPAFGKVFLFLVYEAQRCVSLPNPEHSKHDPPPVRD